MTDHTPTALAVVTESTPQLVQFVEVLPLKSPEHIAQATDFLRHVKTLEKTLEDERKALVAPLKTEAAEIDARYREPRRALERIEGMLKTRLAEVHAAAERARTAALAAASEAAQAGDAEAARVAVVQASAPPPETPGVSVRYKWIPATTDITRIPREYMTVDVGKLQLLAKGNTGPTPPPPVPGIEWIREAIVAARGL